MRDDIRIICTRPRVLRVLCCWACLACSRSAASHARSRPGLARRGCGVPSRCQPGAQLVPRPVPTDLEPAPWTVTSNSASQLGRRHGVGSARLAPRAQRSKLEIGTSNDRNRNGYSDRFRKGFRRDAVERNYPARLCGRRCFSDLFEPIDWPVVGCAHRRQLCKTQIQPSSPVSSQAVLFPNTRICSRGKSPASAILTPIPRMACRIIQTRLNRYPVTSRAMLLPRVWPAE